MTKTKHLDKYIDQFIDDVEKMKTKKEVKKYIKTIIISSGFLGTALILGFAVLFNKGSDDE